MKIGIDVSRAFVVNPTGTERYSSELLTHLLALPEADRHEWVLYTRGEKKIEVTRRNVKIVHVAWKRLWTQGGLALRTWIDELDVLWIPAHTLPVLRKPGLKTVVTIHGIEYEWLPAYENKLQSWYLPLSTQYAVANADKIIAVSQFTANQLVARMGADVRRIRVIHEGVSESRRVEEQESIRALNKYRLKPKKYLLFVGTVQPRKNLVKLIQTFSGLKSELKLVICGKFGWMYDEVLAAPEKFGVKDKVVFTKYVTDAERYTLLQCAALYIQPSITEGFGLPVLEAWHAGLPVVSSKGGALEEIVGDAGLLFDPLDEEDMKKRLEEILKDEKLRSRLVGLGKKRLELFSWERAARETFGVLTSR